MLLVKLMIGELVRRLGIAAEHTVDVVWYSLGKERGDVYLPELWAAWPWWLEFVS